MIVVSRMLDISLPYVFPQAPIQDGDAARTATEILGNTSREQAREAPGTKSPGY